MNSGAKGEPEMVAQVAPCSCIAIAVIAYLLLAVVIYKIFLSRK